jgi:hypothetical protein
MVQALADHLLGLVYRKFYELTEDGPTSIRKVTAAFLMTSEGEFWDQADAKWIVIRWPLRDHNDAPCGRPTPDRPIGRLGVGPP